MAISCDKSKHVAVIAFPFGSHRITLPNLVFKLAHAAPNVIFSYIAPSQHNQDVFSKPNIPHNIKRFDVSDGVPEGYVPGKYPTEKLDFFLKSCPENLKKGVDLAVKSTKLRVTCILSDAFVTPSLTVAQQLDVPWVAAWLCLSTALSVDNCRTQLVHQHCTNNGIEHNKLSRVVGEDETEFSRTLGSIGKVLPEARAVAMNFYEELDKPPFVQNMRSKLKSMLYVGCLTLSASLSAPSIDTTGCLEWLDKQSSRSVVYICFGTATVPPTPELVAIAEALEASGFPFLWTIKDDLKGVLPDGFVERTSVKGKIVRWAPQIQVLAHDSVGVYVTHSGMNSMMESAANGVPMICRTFNPDQVICGERATNDWGFGVKVEGEMLSKNGLIKSLNLILVQEEGKKVREKALRMKKNLQDAARPEGKAAQDFKTLVELISSS